MQNKGAIRLFAIILGLVCLYQMSFTFITRGVESDAREFAAGDTAKERQYLDSIKNVGVYNLGVYNFTYQQCKARELVLGLDLQGGMNVTLEISTVDVIKTLSNNSTDPDFAKAIALAQANEATSDKDFVTLFGEAWEKVAPGKDLASPALFGNSQNKAIVPFKTSNAEVIKFLKEQADVAIENSFLVLRTRIDKFGVTSPNIQKLGTSGRILVELPGVKDKARVRKLLQGSANLEFWETYDNTESYQYLVKAEDVLRALAGGNIGTTADTTKADTTKTAGVDTAKANATAAAKPDTNKKAATATADTNKTVSDTMALTEAEKKAKNPLLYYLNPVIVTNPQTSQQELGRGAGFGVAQVKDTATINKLLATPSVKAIFPANFKALWGAKAEETTDGKSIITLYGIKVTNSDGTPALGGDVIIDARADYQQNSAEAKVSMQMNGEGTQNGNALQQKTLTVQ